MHEDGDKDTAVVARHMLSLQGGGLFPARVKYKYEYIVGIIFLYQNYVGRYQREKKG